MTEILKTNPASEIKSFIRLLAGIPLFMGFFYILFFFFGYLRDIHFVGEHLIALVFWIMNTGLLSVLARWCARPLGLKTAVRLSMLVPALSYSFLFFIYLCALIGNFKIGSVVTYDAAWLFLGDIFNLGRATGIPLLVPVAALVIPMAGLIAFFQWKGSEFHQGIEALTNRFRRHSPRRKRSLFLAGSAAWVIIALALFSLNPHLKFFGHFRHDPVVGFFKNSDFQFSLNKERLLAAKQDQIAAASLRHLTPRSRNIILFVVDALRADHLTFYGYTRPVNPNLAALFIPSLSRKIDWVLSNGSESATGQMAIMSSKETRDISDLVYSLSDNLSDNGFKTIHFYSGDSVWCNFNKSFGKKIDVFIDGKTHPGPNGVNDDRMLLELTDSLGPDDGGRRFLCYHLMSVHEAGYLQDSYLQYKPVINLASYFFHPDSPNFPEEKQGAINMYDDRIIQGDAIIGQIMEKLRQKGYLRDYVGAFTADHGQRLGEDGQFGHGRFVSEAILRVPLLFFGSKPLPAFPDTHFATLWDVAPTLVDLAGLDIPSSWQGQSLLRKRTKFWSYHLSPSARKGNRGAVVYYDQGRILKYSRILSVQGNQPRLEQVFDLANDPEEKNDLIKGIDRVILKQMRSQADEHFVTY